jgi:hypothetical protein
MNAKDFFRRVPSESLSEYFAKVALSPIPDLETQSKRNEVEKLHAHLMGLEATTRANAQYDFNAVDVMALLPHPMHH